MPLYQINAALGTASMSISQVIQQANAGNAGPTPVINPNPNPNYLWVNQLGRQTIDATQNPSSTAAMGLITCASVVMVSANPNDPPVASVYHANAGVITAGDLNQMRLAITQNPNNLPAWGDLMVTYAVTQPWDQGYMDAINVMTGLGIPANRIAWLAQIPIGCFGINSIGQVGVPGVA